jgi:hypothetical protein
MSLATLTGTIRGKMNAEAERRVGRAIEELIQQLQIGYGKKFLLNDGARGALGAMYSEVRRTAAFIEATVNIAPKGNYLLYLEGGVSGTDGSPVGGAVWQRRKMPPVMAIYQWVKRSKVPVPAVFTEAATKSALSHRKKSSKYPQDAEWRFAWAIAKHHQKLGHPALRVLERVTLQQKAHIQTILGGN